MIAAWELAAHRGAAAVLFEGRMVDEPALREARELLALSARIRGRVSGVNDRSGA